MSSCLREVGTSNGDARRLPTCRFQSQKCATLFKAFLRHCGKAYLTRRFRIQARPGVPVNCVLFSISVQGFKLLFGFLADMCREICHNLSHRTCRVIHGIRIRRGCSLSVHSMDRRDGKARRTRWRITDTLRLVDSAWPRHR